jgi:hypothetical protein
MATAVFLDAIVIRSIPLAAVLEPSPVARGPPPNRGRPPVAPIRNRDARSDPGPRRSLSWRIQWGTLTFKITRAEIDGALTAIETFIVQQDGPPLHAHEQDDVIYISKAPCVSSSGIVCAGRQRDRSSHTAGTPHTWQNVGAEPMRFFTASSSSTCFHPAPCSPSTPSGDTTTSSPHDRTLLRNRKTTRARTSLGLTADGFEPAPWFNDKRPLSANNNLRLFSRVLGAYRRSWHAGHPHTRRERSSS